MPPRDEDEEGGGGGEGNNNFVDINTIDISAISSSSIDHHHHLKQQHSLVNNVNNMTKRINRMIENNMDWAATAAIYVDETSTTPLLSDDGIIGFCGTIRLTLLTISSVAFCRRVTTTNNNNNNNNNNEENDDHHHHPKYRYFGLKKSPILKIQLDYIIHSKEEDDDDEEEADDDAAVLPQNLRLEWDYYPPELPEEDKIGLLSWLNDKCKTKLDEENELRSMCTSFSVVELCEHETFAASASASLSSYWEMIHSNVSNGNRLFLLPPKLDHLYHSNVGHLIDPRNEALLLQITTTSTTTKKSKKKVTGWNNKESKAVVVVDVFSPQKQKHHQQEHYCSPIEEYAKQALLQCWKKLYTATCPICFDTINCDRGITLPHCGDFFCYDCFPMYLQMKVSELNEYRTNPFVCPECRIELSIKDLVQQYISTKDYSKIQHWLMDLKYPPCYALDQCLSKVCNNNNNSCVGSSSSTSTMRYRSKSRKDRLIFCDKCDKTWCELCLKRVYRNNNNNKTTGSKKKKKKKEDEDEDEQHTKENCESQRVLKFCRRYLRATDEQKELCQVKFPWITTYARARQEDIEAIRWIVENGQSCPSCTTGVERIEGCFHMKCPTCATHFCYECGTYTL
eukprot:scaffold1834_cov101-Cylindrotheca_fusiformis.AAC.2